MLSLESISERGTMKKAVTFLLILSLSLSGTTSNKVETTFEHIIKDLQKLNEANPPITFSSPVNHNIFKNPWTCNTSRELLEQLNVALDKVNTDELSQSINTTLTTIKKNVKTIKDFFSKGQILKGKKPCRRGQCNKNPLGCYLRVLRCLNRNCTAT